MLEMVQETCNNMINTNNNLKEAIHKQACTFIHTAANRTSDVVPSLPILETKLYSLLQLFEGQGVEDEAFNLSAADLKKFSRFITEE